MLAAVAVALTVAEQQALVGLVVVATQVRLEVITQDRLEVLIPVAAEVVHLTYLRLLQAAQAAPALLSSSTPYQAKLYLRSKERPLGNARQV